MTENEIIKTGKNVIKIEAGAVADLEKSINKDFVNAVEADKSEIAEEIS